MKQLLKNNNLSRVNQRFNRLLIVLLMFTLLPLLLISCVGTDSTSSSSSFIDTSPDVTTSRLKEIIDSKKIPDLASESDEFSKSILTNFEVATDTEIVARYATVSGAGAKNGTNWANAWAGADLKDKINVIANASQSKVYLVLVAGGTYNPTADADRTKSFSMKNYVGIVGGFQDVGGWSRNGTTTFSGDIGVASENNDNSYHVFAHESQTLDHALLYGVTVTGGNASGSEPNNNYGGGMYNNATSPRIMKVIFSDNSAENGGGMYNAGSSPRIADTEFSDNSAENGGGMYNNASSSPTIVRVVFSDNNAVDGGGGMYNAGSSPTIVDTVFGDNSAENGGGVYNFSEMSINPSSPTIFNSVFTDNSATSGRGGAVYNDSSSLLVIGSVFMGNSAAIGGGISHDGEGATLFVYNNVFNENTASTSGPDIALITENNTTSEKMVIAGSVLGVGLDTAKDGIVKYGESAAIDIGYYRLVNKNLGTLGTATLANGIITYPSISEGSSAHDLGVYVQESGGTYYISPYLSPSGNNWYTSLGDNSLGGTAQPLPEDAVDLTATDITGNPRVGQPDAGVYELRSAAPAYLVFQGIVESRKVPDFRGVGDEFSKTIFTNFEVPTGTEIVARYATESGAGAKDGTSWDNAWAGVDLRLNISNITDAKATKVYVVLVAGGTYKPTTGTERGFSFAMKNYVAIIGGFEDVGGWDRTGTTVFSGRITTYRSYHVFKNVYVGNHALLYGVTVTGGNANSYQPYLNGGGMHNEYSSPRIINVIFSDNGASQRGGGMYNSRGSSPLIVNVKFNGNIADSGGGMYNDNSSPTILDTVFSSNNGRDYGGGLYNTSKSYPLIIGAVFVGNSTKYQGGGMFSYLSTDNLTSNNFLTIINSVFVGNSSQQEGGGMFNNLQYVTNTLPLLAINTVFNNNRADQRGGGVNHRGGNIFFINSVFVGNTANNSSPGPGGGLYYEDIYEKTSSVSMYNTIFLDNTAPKSTSSSDKTSDIGVDGRAGKSIRLVGSVLGVGKSTAQDGIQMNVGDVTPDITYRSLANVDPGTTFTTSMLGIEYTTVSKGVGAKNLGLYVKHSGNITDGYKYYMSEDNNTWYTAVTSDGKFNESTKTTTLPADAKDLTAFDISGKARNGRPDAGVIEE